MVKLSEAQVMELVSNPAWKEIAERIQTVRNNNEGIFMVSPDPYTHGMGVGFRKICDLILGLPKQLQDEISGKNLIVHSLKDNIIPFKK